MSWIQENKFVAGLAGVTAVLAGGIFFYGNSQGSEYDEKVSQYQQLKNDYRKLQQSKPFPSNGNLQSKKANIAKYEDLIKDVRGTFAGFKAGEMKKITPEEFGNLRVKMDKELRAAFGQETTLPEETAFGFEKYTSAPPKSEATAMLEYELNAVQWLLTQLANAKPSEVNNILRDELAVEKGKPTAAPQPVRRGGRNKNRRAPQAAPAKKAYTLMPMELAFTGTESTLREFLKTMVNSEQYFFAIRALRIRNEKQVAPNVKDAGFRGGGGGGGAAPAPAPEDDPFAGIALPGDEEEPAPDDGGDAVPVPAPKPAAGSGERILQQVLGGEKLHVFIRFDIVFIEGNSAPPKAQP
ncbi:MAG: Amuc_1100 family pilus-like protein [Akkermansiaceae bacterium]